MSLVLLDKMLERVNRYGADSDSALFSELLYAGEFIVKLSAAALIASIEDDRENHRYRLLHDIVRADGVGDWARAIDETLTGPASQQLAVSLSDVRKAYTERLGPGNWQQKAVIDLHNVLVGVQVGTQPVPEKVQLRSWFQMFAELRNKTRGHGALTPATCAKLAPRLRDSIHLLVSNSPLFILPWAYLHRNLSGKYKVVSLGGDQEVFSFLKSASAVSDDNNYPDGIYVWNGRSPSRVDLIETDLDVSDFFMPNGAFRGGTFELHSLITDSRLSGDASPYMRAASERPPSETEGKGALEVQGKIFTNIPVVTSVYVSRPKLEAKVMEALVNDRHPVVTLVGRGGIGKTSIALTVLHEIAKTDRYDVIVWFSSRDIDLMMSGAKQVRPRVVTDREIAEEYRSLVGGSAAGPDGKINAITYMADHLRKSPLGPTLFVFDNFETVRSPVDLFHWIDTNIRLPNKVAITSRFRDFKADYPIEVMGMEDSEAEALVIQTAKVLGIESLIGKKERALIVEESNAHPYVIKLVLGEIANAGSFSKPSVLIARKDDILDALFERTYANLSPMASRVFLTLSGWRSLVPQIAVEAVLLRDGSGGGDPEAGIDQLVRMSLVERTSAGDESDFLEVPLAAALFGRRKLEVSPSRTLIESDLKFLQDIGVTAASGLKDGIRPRVEAFYKKAARRLSGGSATIEELRPVLEFLARGYAPAWLLLSDLEQEIAGSASLDRAAECVRRFLETQPSAVEAEKAWRRLVTLYQTAGDVIGGCGAFLKGAETNEPPLNEVSAMANWLNNSPEAKDGVDVLDRKVLFKPFARLMEAFLPEASATDLSRLAWLHLHSGDTLRALEVAEIGLQREPDNIHCRRLVAKLTEGDGIR